jgi:hypothetical protein
MTTPSKFPSWSLGTVFAVAGGIMLVLLALGSVLAGVRANHQQRQLVTCGAQVIEQTIAALKARDVAQLNINDQQQIIVRARQVAYHAMADAVSDRLPGGTAALDTAMAVYDKAVDDYTVAITADDAAIRQAPLPQSKCFTANTSISQALTACTNCQ